MTTPLRIFIGWDSRFPEPAEVLANSIRKHASIPVEIRYLNAAELEEEYGFRRQHDPKASTEFTYSRFLVPYLCRYEGIAVFMDNDMLCLADVAELASYPMLQHAIRCVHHDYNPKPGVKMAGMGQQEAYPRKNWSSLMLLNCEKLKLWTKELVEVASGAYLHRFQDIPDALIGELDPAWNCLDSYDPATSKLVHYTSGMVWNHADWKSLRTAGQLPEYPHRQLWLDAYDELYG